NAGWRLSAGELPIPRARVWYLCWKENGRPKTHSWNGERMYRRAPKARTAAPCVRGRLETSSVRQQCLHAFRPQQASAGNEQCLRQARAYTRAIASGEEERSVAETARRSSRVALPV